MPLRGKYYPPGVPPIPDDSDFFDDLAGVVEEHCDDPEKEYRYLCGMVYFAESWKSEPGSWIRYGDEEQ